MRVREITPSCDRSFARPRRANDFNPDCHVNPARNGRDSILQRVALDRLSLRSRAWQRKLETIAVICATLLASFEALNADELLYLRCNLRGMELSGGQSKPYNDTVVFKLNLQTNEAWEIHPDHLLHYKRRIAAEIDENAIRLSRGDEGDVRSSDTSYRIDRTNGSIVFSDRTTWYDIPMGVDDSLTHATGTCEKAPGPLPSRAQLNSST
jgi:hypothetical protein